MPMTVMVTRNAPDRVRGFLASCMCEIAPGVYTAPRMTKAVRERVWAVMEKWHEPGEDRSVLLTWPDGSQPGGQAVSTLGLPRQELHDYNGVHLARRPIDDETRERVETMSQDDAPADLPSGA